MAGVAQGTIFYHFKTKEKLFTSIPKHFKISIIDEFERYMDKRRFEAGPDMVEGAVLFHLSIRQGPCRTVSFFSIAGRKSGHDHDG